MIKIGNLKKIVVFFLLFFIIDLAITQWFLKNFYYKNLYKQRASDLENRIHNKHYMYTFAKKKSFQSVYTKYKYIIHTNNLGFRDYKVKDVEKEKNYILVIGDSYVESVALNYEDTLVGHLNKKNNLNKVGIDEFLNAGVTSYSSYIYLKKIERIFKENPWLKVKKVILLMDKSDVVDAPNFFHRPEFFPVEKDLHSVDQKDLFIYDLKKANFWRFYYKQTTGGAVLKKIGDKIEHQTRYLRDKYKLSKKLKKNIFMVSPKEIQALRSINTRSDISSLFEGKAWEESSKKSIDFAFENILLIKNFLKSKDVDLLVVLFPWPFEIVEKNKRDNYINYVLPKLQQNDINYLFAYKPFLKDNLYLNIFENYIYNDIHFNSKGNKLLSEIILNKITNN